MSFCATSRRSRAETVDELETGEPRPQFQKIYARPIIISVTSGTSDRCSLARAAASRLSVSLKPRPQIYEYASLSRKRQEADIFAAPSRMRECRTLMTANCAARVLAQQVARCVGTPPDDELRERHRCAVIAARAIDPRPVHRRSHFRERTRRVSRPFAGAATRSPTR